jgi:hypothetical protein
MAYTNIDDPSAYFQTLLWTGNDVDGRALTNDGNSNLKPDLVWLKNRNAGYNHFLVDSSRGTSVYLSSNTTTADTTWTNLVESFNTDGFTVGDDGSQVPNHIGNTFVAWQWKANGGTTSSNTTGSINATVQANTTAGFSIITWTGTGSVGTIGHGLGQAPAVLIVKNRTTGVDWAVYHQDLIDAGYVIALNSTDAQVDSGTNRWNHTAPTSSVFSVGAGQQTNQSSNNMVCYAFAEKQGYSKFGSYWGNGSTDGPFVYTGFKPAFVMIKSIINSGQNWLVQDSKRPAYNPTSGRLFANTSGAENTDTELPDFLSNGFKVRSTSYGNNRSSEKYIYMAFAENPFVTSTGVPACAR